jgi:hypothetical protein
MLDLAAFLAAGLPQYRQGPKRTWKETGSFNNNFNRSFNHGFNSIRKI